MLGVADPNTNTAPCFLANQYAASLVLYLGDLSCL